MLHKLTFSAVKKKKRKKTWKIISFDKVFSTERLTTDGHQVSQRAFPLSCAVLTTHTLKPPEDAGNLCSTSPPPPLLPPHLSLAVKCLALMLDITVRRFLARHQTARGILVPPSGHFSQYQHRFAFQEVGISQEQYYGMLKQGQQGEPMQRKSCRNIQRKTQHLTLMWKLLN